tara:strand:- start:489 stop:842 length:354 start_codon:yes stop_codon:yes gene_type:complete
MKNIENGDDLSQEILSSVHKPHQIVANLLKDSMNLFQNNIENKTFKTKLEENMWEASASHYDSNPNYFEHKEFGVEVNPCPFEVEKAALEYQFEELEWAIESLTARKKEIKEKIEAC